MSTESAALAVDLTRPARSRWISRAAHAAAFLLIPWLTGWGPVAAWLMVLVLVSALWVDRDLRRLRYRRLLWHTAGPVSLVTKDGTICPAIMHPPVWTDASHVVLRVQPEDGAVERIVVERETQPEQFRQLMMRLTVENV